MSALQRSGLHASPAPVDRRRQRSSAPEVAMTLALTHAARRAHLDCMLLLDGGGNVVFRAQPDHRVPRFVTKGKVDRICEWGKKRGMNVRAIDIAGQSFFVVAIGGDVLERKRELFGGTAAARRILA